MHARAKRVILLFMNGGPSQVDTFDPKPALVKHRGKPPSGKLYKKHKGDGFLPSPFTFSQHGQSGMWISESLPEMAKLADDLCVIRSMHTDVPNHEPALLQMHTGNVQPIRPSFGSWLLYGLGNENNNLPGYVVLRPSRNIVVGPALWSSSFLPARYQATSVVTNDLRVDHLLQDIKNPRWNSKQQKKQLDLIRAINAQHSQQRPADSHLESEIASMETAFKMQTEASEAFDVSKETATTRALYGKSDFANSCLLARRLVERGVRVVSVYYVNKSNQPWDTHAEHNRKHPTLCADSDRATAALLKDLKSRGLLDDTLVIWTGEFGRTPYSENRNTNSDKLGRDHHSTAFTTVLAGGGITGGLTYGQSDELCMGIDENPVHVHDLHATMLHLMGLDHEALTFRYSGRDFRLTDVKGNVITELFS